MPVPEPKAPGIWEAGYRAVSLQASDESSPLRLNVVVQDAGDPVGGPFVLLRSTSDALVYLGCVTDAAGEVHQWIEIWVQSVDGFVSRFGGNRACAGNRYLDEEWIIRAESFRRLGSRGVISTPWEETHPFPIFYDLGLTRAVHPQDKETGAKWELCRDDALLESKGLPPYSTSLARYLYLSATGDASAFVPVTKDAPENASTRALTATFGNLIPFNPSGGLMLIRPFAPLSSEAWIQLISGKPWKGLEHGRKAFKPGGTYRTIQDATQMQQGSGHLLLSHAGLAGRLAEAFHLKLHFITGTLRLLRSLVRAHQVPFLNLSADSFRIRFGSMDNALPHLWNHEIIVADPGAAIALPIASTQARYFLPAETQESSVYRPATQSLRVSGSGMVRIRKTGGDENSFFLEGTLATQERVVTGANDLLWLRVTLPSGHVDLYAQLDRNEATSAGEMRFRTIPQKLGPATVMALQQAEGVALPNIPFETVPLLSSPCDLHALAVLAVRTLLVDDGISLPIALDEFFALIREAGTYDSSATLEQRVRAVITENPNRSDMLGPHRLIADEIATESALRLFPPSLWWDALAAIGRLFPGLSPDSWCRDFSDAPHLALEKVFDQPLAAFEQLLVRSRSLLVIDWGYNREISAVIQQCRSRLTGVPR